MMSNILRDDHGNVSNVMAFLCGIGVDSFVLLISSYLKSLSHYICIVLRFLQGHMQPVLQRFFNIIFIALLIESFTEC
jgi:hypothetical protein